LTKTAAASMRLRKSWADEQGYSRKSGDYKKANKPFHDQIMALPEDVQERIIAETEEWAVKYIKAFGSEGTAELVLEVVSSRRDYNSTPERRIFHSRSEFAPEKAPDAGRAKKAEGKDFSD